MSRSIKVIACLLPRIQISQLIYQSNMFVFRLVFFLLCVDKTQPCLSSSVYFRCLTSLNSGSALRQIFFPPLLYHKGVSVPKDLALIPSIWLFSFLFFSIKAQDYVSLYTLRRALTRITYSAVNHFTRVGVIVFIHLWACHSRLARLEPSGHNTRRWKRKYLRAWRVESWRFIVAALPTRSVVYR